MPSVIRGGQRLARYSDGQLAQLVASCICLGINGDDLIECVNGWQASGRKAVVQAACAYDLLALQLTRRVVLPPSDESKAWSSVEGGHRFHQTPVLNINDLITGHITVKEIITTGF